MTIKLMIVFLCLTLIFLLYSVYKHDNLTAKYIHDCENHGGVFIQGYRIDGKAVLGDYKELLYY